jgi:hypothetical protein
MIDLVNRDQDRFSGFTEFLGEHSVDRVNAGSTVGDENNGVGHLHRELGFGLNLIVKRIADRAADAAGINQSYPAVIELEISSQTVSGHPWLIMHNSNPSP